MVGSILLGLFGTLFILGGLAVGLSQMAAASMASRPVSNSEALRGWWIGVPAIIAGVLCWIAVFE